MGKRQAGRRRVARKPRAAWRSPAWDRLRDWCCRGVAQLVENGSWDLAWDIVTVVTSFVDICCDIGVAWTFYSAGYVMLFRAACAIFLLAQVSYATVYIIVCSNNKWTHQQRVVMFVLVLPFAQLIPIIFWLQSFDIPWLNRALKKFDLQPLPKESEEEEEDRLLVYIKSKLRSHLGFVIEAFVEAVPQCLLQTAAICMYPELATSSSIYSILMSIIVVASKAYLVSYSPVLPRFLLNVVCIVADLVCVFASTTWVFSAHEAETSIIVSCLTQAVRHGVLLAMWGIFLWLLFIILSDLERSLKKPCKLDAMRYVYFVMDLLLLVPPACVVLCILKLGLVPVISALFEGDDECRFEQALLQLLPSRLSLQERQRRVRAINLFALFTEVQALSPEARGGMAESAALFRRTRMRVHAQRVGWYGWVKASRPAPGSDNRRQQQSALQLIQSLSTSQVPVQIPRQRNGLAWVQTCQTSCREQLSTLGKGLADLRKEASARAVWPEVVDAIKEKISSRQKRIAVYKFLVVLALAAVTLRHGPPFIFFAVLYFVQGSLHPLTKLAHHLRMQGGAAEVARLPVALSSAFCLCLLCICTLVLVLAWRRQRLQVFVWKRREMMLPKGFVSLATATAMAEACRDEARQEERAWLLRQRGLPIALAAHVVDFVDPFVGRR